MSTPISEMMQYTRKELWRKIV